MDKVDLEKRFYEVAPSIYCWKAPEVETYQTLDFFIDKMIQLNSKHENFSIIIDINEQTAPLQKELGKHFFKRHSNANLVFLTNFCVLTSKPHILSRVIMKLGSSALGFKASYFKELDICIEKIQSQSNLTLIKRIKNSFFNLTIYLQQNNNTSFHITEKNINKAHTYLLLPFVLISLIFIPIKNNGYSLELLVSQRFLFSLIPIIAITITKITSQFFSFSRIILPLSLVFQGSLFIMNEQIVHNHPYVITYPAMTAIGLAWFLTSLNQLLLVIALSFLSLFIGNFYGELFSFNDILQMEIIFMVIGPLAFFARVIYNQSEADFIAQQEKINQNNKLSQIGQLNTSIAHEINNPLAIISGNSTYMKKSLEKIKQEHPELSELLDPCFIKIEKQNLAMKRINNIIITMRRFARKQTDHFSNFSIREAILETKLLIDDMLKRENIEFELEINISDDNLQIFGEQEQIIQVITNLITNAKDAVKDCYNKKITLQMIQVDNKSINIYVKDNGHGIPEDIKSKVFEQFFSTKPPSAGGGMGLSITQSMVESHNGKISFFSNDEGTTFIISLPISTYEQIA